MSDGRDEPNRGGVPGAYTGCRWVRAAGTLWRNAGDTVVLLPEGGHDQAHLVVSGSAALLWDLLADPVTLSELAAELAVIYEADTPRIEADLVPILEGLLAAGAIEHSP